ncbi:MAG TPA: hypothetical protein VLM38_14920 [Blastocatellia bacterium]|nr:hypothetical protein [Blastocatellia bacterium]
MSPRSNAFLACMLALAMSPQAWPKVRQQKGAPSADKDKAAMVTVDVLLQKRSTGQAIVGLDKVHFLGI